MFYLGFTVLFYGLSIGHHGLGFMRIVPFRPWLASSSHAQAVASPPFDVPTRAEAVSMAQSDWRNFLHVVRPEVDWPEEVDVWDAKVYERARRNLVSLQEQLVLVREPRPVLYVYRMEDGAHRQTGIVACVSAADYLGGLIRTHEHTRVLQEDDRVRHMHAIGAHAEPVLLTFRAQENIRSLLELSVQVKPLLTVTDADGVHHLVWRVTDPSSLIAAFEEVPHCYIADGHHRSAAAVRLASSGVASHFPAVLFASDELRILAYNRAIRGVGGHRDEGDLLRQLGKLGRLVHPAKSTPEKAGIFAIRVRSGWYHLHLETAEKDCHNLIASLDAERLQRTILEPLLGVGDPRNDDRFMPVGGRDSVARLENLVDSGKAEIGFSLVAPTVDQMLAVADADEVMPPKSTWIEPKIRSGLFVNPFEGD